MNTDLKSEKVRKWDRPTDFLTNSLAHLPTCSIASVFIRVHPCPSVSSVVKKPV